jgi:predicted amidohydrolase YtcJ
MSSTLFINAKVWQPNGTFDEAFGIKDNRITFTGANSDADALKFAYSQTIDLKGRLVLPGLIDGHLHLVRGSLMRKRFDASGVKDIATLKSAIDNYISANPGTEWVIGSNLDINSITNNTDLSNGNFTDEIYSQ